MRNAMATATGKRSWRAGSIRAVNEQTDRDSNREIAATDLFCSSFEFTPEREMFRENAGVVMSEGRAAACRSDEKTDLVKNERRLDRSIDRSMGSTRRSPGGGCLGRELRELPWRPTFAPARSWSLPPLLSEPPTRLLDRTLSESHLSS